MKTIRSFLTVLMISITLLGCNKHKIDNWKTIKQLYNKYKNGSIDECRLNSERVYVGAINAYDSGSEIYDKNYKVIGNCNFAWGKVDTICKQLEDCEVIYRVEHNIWGQAAIDKYRLGK